MTWSNVEPHIKFYKPSGPGVSDPSPATVNNVQVRDNPAAARIKFPENIEDAIKSAIQTAYASDNFRPIVNDRPYPDIWIVNGTNTEAPPNTGVVFLDLNTIVGHSYFGKTGEAFAVDLKTVIVHELTHALGGLLDPTAVGKRENHTPIYDYSDPNFDFYGDATRKTNVILDDMFYENKHQYSGYSVTYRDARQPEFQHGLSYSENNVISNTVLDNEENLRSNFIDTSHRSDGSNDLIFGGIGEDSILSGAGNDYMYGGSDDDKFSPGSGNDVVHGGLRKVAVAGDGTDTAEYSKGDNGAAPQAGITIKLGEPGAELDGDRPIVVSNDGYGGTDRLFSIEKIIGTAKDDTLIIKDIDLTNYALSNGKLEIDLGAQTSTKGDTLDASGATKAINMKDGQIEGAPALILKGFETIKLTAFDDYFDYSSETMAGGATDFEGGDGADTIIGGAGDDILVGGNKLPDQGPWIPDETQDQLEGGSGSDTYHVVMLPYDDRGFVIGEKSTGYIKASETFDLSKWSKLDYLVINDASDKIAIHNDYWSEPATLDLSTATIERNDPFFSLINQDVYRVSFDGDSNHIIIREGDDWYFAGFIDPDNDDIPGRYFPVAILKDFDPSILGDSPPAEEGGEEIVGTPGDDQISGSSGGDTISGGAGADTLTGGSGNDRVYGDGGDDTYAFNRGDGEDEFYETETGTEGGFDIVKFGVGISATDLQVSQISGTSDMLVQIVGTSDQFTIKNGSGDGGSRIEQLLFDDGSTLSFDDLVALSLIGTSRNEMIQGTSTANVILGNGGNDTLFGVAGNDTLIGGTGDDWIIGSDGDDTYVFSLGDGDDLIQEELNEYLPGGGQDTIEFGAGITVSDLVLSATNGGNDLLIQIAGTTDQITVKDWLTAESARVETITFADGSTLTYAQILAMLPSTEEPDVDVTLEGDAADNVLTSGTGNDTLKGLAGADTLTGGKGDDLVIGNAGDDVYVFNRGDGQDVFRDEFYGGGGFDTIQFGAGVTAADLLVSQPAGANDLLIKIVGTTDQITVTYGLWADDNRIEQVRFDDGSTLSFADLRAMALTGTAAAELLEGDADANAILGAGGEDSLIGHAGADTLTGGTGDDWVVGGTGNDTYVFNRGDGQDLIEENSHTGPGGGSDRIQFGAGVTAADLVFSETSGGNDLLIQIAGTTDQITIKDGLVSEVDRIELVRFSDGSTLTYAQMLEALQTDGGTAGADTLEGDAGANILTGGAGDDSLRGYGGADTLTGSAGNDIVIGNAGDDTYVFNLGDGQDIVRDEFWGGGGFDTIQFGAGITEADLIVSQPAGANDMLIKIAGTSDQITVLYGFWADDNRIEQVRFDDGSTLSFADLRARALSGTAANELLEGDTAANAILGAGGNDSLIGHDGADTLTGGAENDWAVGGTGDDIYVFSLGDGQDLIEEDSHTGPGGGEDMILFGAGVTASDLVLTSTGGGNDLLIEISGSTDQITIKDGLVGEVHRIEKFKFADGVIWDQQQINAHIDLI